MKPFVQFMTITNLRVFIDPQAIIRLTEHKYRENDIGYVGTQIEYTWDQQHGGISYVNVKDPIDAVANALAGTPKGIDIPALNETLILNKEPDPVLTENRNNFRQAMQEKGAKAAQDRSYAVLVDTPQQVAHDTETVAKNLAKILQQPDSRLDYETDTQEKSFNWEDYRLLERGEKIYAADRTKMNERISLRVQSELIGKSFSLKEHPQVYRQYVFQPGDTVQLIHHYNKPIYKVIKTVEDLLGHLSCVLEGRKQSVRVRELVLYTPTTYRTPSAEIPPVTYTPGEIPTCNGNGEAQSTEE